MKAIEWLKLIKDPVLKGKALKAVEDYPMSPYIEVNSIRDAILYAFSWNSGSILDVDWADLYAMPPELISKEELIENHINETSEALLGENAKNSEEDILSNSLRESAKINPIDMYYSKALILAKEAEKNLNSDDYQFFLKDLNNIYMENFSRNPSNPVFAAYDVRIKEYFKIHQNQSKAIDCLKKFSTKMKNLCLEMAHEKIFERICLERGVNQETCSAEELLELMEIANEELRIFKKENIQPTINRSYSKKKSKNGSCKY